MNQNATEVADSMRARKVCLVKNRIMTEMKNRVDGMKERIEKAGVADKSHARRSEDSSLERRQPLLDGLLWGLDVSLDEILFDAAIL